MEHGYRSQRLERVRSGRRSERILVLTIPIKLGEDGVSADGFGCREGKSDGEALHSFCVNEFEEVAQ